jgi:hypothetical protein
MRNLYPSGEKAGYAATILGLATACSAVATNQATIGPRLGIDLSFLNNDSLFRVIYVFMGLAGLVILLWLIGLLVRHTLIVPAKIAAEKLARIIDRFDSLTLETCITADLAEISRISAAEFGPLAASLQRNEWLFGLDDQSYWKITDRTGVIVGFYTLFRLTAAGTRAVRRGDFGITICPPEYLCKDKKYYYCNLYVAGMYGKSKRARAMIWGALNQRVVQLRPKNMFARAATEDGLRLLEQAKFTPVQAGKAGVGALYRR